MPLKLVYRDETTLPVEIEGLTPDWAWDKPLAEIERFEIFQGNQKLPLGALFTVQGDAVDKRFDFEGDLSGVHWIGAHMRSGQIHVHGPVGRHVGSEMRGGEIQIDGDAAGWVGCEMRGGLIHIRGNAGHLVGAAYRGSVKGMNGGTILVDGNAGNEVGLTMQQGIIAIGGNAGNMLGFNMKDGTVIVIGNGGIRAGAGMRGGTIAILGPTPPTVLPSFRFDRTAPPERITVLIQDAVENSLRIDDARLPSAMDVYQGDLIAEGSGELLLRHVD